MVTWRGSPTLKDAVVAQSKPWLSTFTCYTMVKFAKKVSRARTPRKPGKPGRSGKSGKPGKPGKSGKSGKSGQSGKSGKNGQCGKGGNKAWRAREDIFTMAHALLTSTLEKLEGATAAQECAAFAPSRFLEHPEWPTHQRCEVDPDLDATSLDLLASCIKIPLHMALARSWVTRIIANHDGGLRELGMMGWSLQPGQLSLQTVRAAFKKLTLSNACPLERLVQWQAFAKKHKLVLKGCDQRMWTANLFHKLTQSGAWEKAARAGLSHETLEKHLELHSRFLRKLVLHDVWLSHRRGEVTWLLKG